MIAFYINISAVVTLMLQTVYQVVNYSHTISYILYVPYFLVLVIAFASGGKVKVPTGYRYVYISIVMCYIIGPMLSWNINISAFSYAMLLIIFSLAVVYMGRALANDLLNIKKMAFCGAIFLVFLVVTNLNAYRLSNIYSALGLGGIRNTIARESFGFWHPNAAGYMFATEIILLSFAIIIEESLYKKIIEYFLISIFALSMLASGCRTAVITIIVFFAMKVSLKATRTFSRMRVAVLAVLFVAFCICFSLVNGFDNLIEASSGRNLAIGNVIRYLNEEGKLLFGYGATRVSEGSIGITIDNWYLNILAYYGIFGLAGMLLGIILLLISIYRVIRYIPNEDIKESIISFIVMFLLYGFCENVIYVPGVTLCGIFWVIMNMFYFYTKEHCMQ